MSFLQDGATSIVLIAFLLFIGVSLVFYFCSKSNNPKLDGSISKEIKENNDRKPSKENNLNSNTNKISLTQVEQNKFLFSESISTPEINKNYKNSELQIENSKRTGILQLSKNNLSRFPNILELSNKLRSVDLSHNNLQSIPQIIRQFSHLKQFFLNNNQLNDFPQEMANLKKLENLSADYNKIKELPESFSNLSNLRIISLSHNELTVFPIVLCRLKNIDFIDLSNNQLIEIPNDIQYINALELNLNHNRISIFPPLIAQCKRLKVLRLNNNCLEPTAIITTILAESQISLLTIEGNLFDDKTFRQLDGYDCYSERLISTKKKIDSI